jgi:hypothetical protein
VFVSFIAPTLELQPSGNDGRWWVSGTVLADGRVVSMRDVVGGAKAGLRAVANTARRQLVATNACVRRSQGYNGGDYATGFAPIASSFRYFALLPSGLYVGFPNGQVAGTTCGRVLARVGYEALRPYLTSLGKTLVASVAPACRS